MTVNCVARFQKLVDAAAAGQRIAEDLMIDVAVEGYALRFWVAMEKWTTVARIVRDFGGRLASR